MARYHVRFMKTVPDSTGHDHYLCQFETVVEAECKDEAANLAAARFCAEHHIPHWCHHAEAMELETLPGYLEECERADAVEDAWAFMG